MGVTGICYLLEFFTTAKETEVVILSIAPSSAGLIIQELGMQNAIRLRRAVH